jgi:hypothetical protein
MSLFKILLSFSWRLLVSYYFPAGHLNKFSFIFDFENVIEK